VRTEQAFASAPGAQDRLVIVVADGSFGDGKRLVEHFDDVELRFGDLSDVGALADLTAGASAVVVTLQPLRAAHIAAFAPSVRVIGRAGVGVDTIDLEAAEAAGITVVNQPGYGTREVASHAVALLLALQRRLCGLDDYVRRGRIGRVTAEMLKGLVGEILVYDPAAPSLADGAVPAPLDELLARSDVVSLHLPLTPETAGMVDAAFLAMMSPGALLVNVSRGGLVDEDALVAALDSGHIGGAALDVFPVEPLPQTSPLLGAKNTLFTPHCASYSERSVWRLASWTVSDTIAWLRSNTIEHGNFVVRGTR
jgi:D-3-phosphoglycerate dehydrogenase